MGGEWEGGGPRGKDDGAGVMKEGGVWREDLLGERAGLHGGVYIWGEEYLQNFTKYRWNSFIHIVKSQYS